LINEIVVTHRLASLSTLCNLRQVLWDFHIQTIIQNSTKQESLISPLGQNNTFVLVCYRILSFWYTWCVSSNEWSILLFGNSK